MVIYTYRCSQCDHEEDVLQKPGGSSVECPYCLPFLMDRVIGTPGIRLIGRGFHDTDYTRFGPKRKG